MAQIIRHPDVEDYFVEITPGDIRSRPHGIIDLFEANRLVILKDYKLPVDLDVFAQLRRFPAGKFKDPVMRGKFKMMSAGAFCRGDAPRFVEGPGGGSYEPLVTSDPVRRAIYEEWCKSDPELFARAIAAMKSADEAAMALLGDCFPSYQYFRSIPSVRLTTTLFEYMHWDKPPVSADHHEVRMFCNLDVRPRIWHTSHNVIAFARAHYRELKLDRFAGRDPREMAVYIDREFMGGPANHCRDGLPRHVVAFEPGEVWIAETRFISHQIFYGERALAYAFLLEPEYMMTPSRRLNAQVANLHASMGALAP